MVEIIIAILAGGLMAVQGVFNTRLTEGSSLWVANSLVHLSGLVLCIVIWFFNGKESFSPIYKVNKLYLLGGILGVGIIYAVIKSISSLGPSISVMIFLTSQLLVAYLIELFGLFGTDAVDFSFKKIIGMAIIIFGIIIFKI